jgi:hypothetical protein
MDSDGDWKPDVEADPIWGDCFRAQIRAGNSGRSFHAMLHKVRWNV